MPDFEKGLGGGGDISFLGYAADKGSQGGASGQFMSQLADVGDRVVGTFYNNIQTNMTNEANDGARVQMDQQLHPDHPLYKPVTKFGKDMANLERARAKGTLSEAAFWHKQGQISDDFARRHPGMREFGYSAYAKAIGRNPKQAEMAAVRAQEREARTEGRQRAAEARAQARFLQHEHVKQLDMAEKLGYTPSEKAMKSTSLLRAEITAQNAKRAVVKDETAAIALRAAKRGENDAVVTRKIRSAMSKVDATNITNQASALDALGSDTAAINNLLVQYRAAGAVDDAAFIKEQIEAGVKPDVAQNVAADRRAMFSRVYSAYGSNDTNVANLAVRNAEASNKLFEAQMGGTPSARRLKMLSPFIKNSATPAAAADLAGADFQQLTDDITNYSSNGAQARAISGVANSSNPGLMMGTAYDPGAHTRQFYDSLAAGEVSGKDVVSVAKATGEAMKVLPPAEVNVVLQDTVTNMDKSPIMAPKKVSQNVALFDMVLTPELMDRAIKEKDTNPDLYNNVKLMTGNFMSNFMFKQIDEMKDIASGNNSVAYMSVDSDGMAHLITRDSADKETHTISAVLTTLGNAGLDGLGTDAVMIARAQKQVDLVNSLVSRIRKVNGGDMAQVNAFWHMTGVDTSNGALVVGRDDVSVNHTMAKIDQTVVSAMSKAGQAVLALPQLIQKRYDTTVDASKVASLQAQLKNRGITFEKGEIKFGTSKMGPSSPAAMNTQKVEAAWGKVFDTLPSVPKDIHVDKLKHPGKYFDTLIDKFVMATSGYSITSEGNRVPVSLSEFKAYKKNKTLPEGWDTRVERMLNTQAIKDAEAGVQRDMAGKHRLKMGKKQKDMFDQLEDVFPAEVLAGMRSVIQDYSREPFKVSVPKPETPFKVTP